MSRSMSTREVRSGRLAYKLGYEPVLLDHRARLYWETAVLIDPFYVEQVDPRLLPTDGAEDLAEPIPSELERYFEEIRSTSEELSTYLPACSVERLTRTLHDATERAWS